MGKNTINLPKNYRYLLEESAPKILLSALKFYGVTEIPGPESNDIIMSWAKELGLERVYTNDDIAWCGLFVAKVVHDAGYDPVSGPLWALNWKKFEGPSKEAGLGDILVFVRKLANGGTAGHVGIYVGEDEEAYHVLGGNQSNQVNITRVAKSRLVGIRRPKWKIGQPESVRPIHLSKSGKLSENEA